MTDIIKLAREAAHGRLAKTEVEAHSLVGYEEIKRFAELVAAPLKAENEELRTDAECFRFWVHEAWHSPSDMARLLSKCETKQDYINAIIPMIEASRSAIDAARAKEQT
jgi:dimeric dUTPase (all-alpha-NTP-PPase superfamily)